MLKYGFIYNSVLIIEHSKRLYPGPLLKRSSLIKVLVFIIFKLFWLRDLSLVLPPSMPFNYRGFGTDVQWALRSIGQEEMGADCAILSEIAAVRRPESCRGRGVMWGKFSLRSSLAKLLKAQPAPGTCETWSWRCLVSIAALRKFSGQ